jgi:hypothetical protein
VGNLKIASRVMRPRSSVLGEHKLVRVLWIHHVPFWDSTIWNHDVVIYEVMKSVQTSSPMFWTRLTSQSCRISSPFVASPIAVGLFRTLSTRSIQLLRSKTLLVQQKLNRHVGELSAAMNHDAIRIQLGPSLRSPSDECATRCVCESREMHDMRDETLFMQSLHKLSTQTLHFLRP